MLYETWARAEEVLGLGVPDLDMEFRRALVVEKGGDRAYVHWETPTARLLPRLLAGRTAGPIFLADRRAPAAGRRAAALSDICPDTGRGWPSYPRAEYLFKQASQLHDPHGARSWRPIQIGLTGVSQDGATGPLSTPRRPATAYAKVRGRPRCGVEDRRPGAAALQPADDAAETLVDHVPHGDLGRVQPGPLGTPIGAHLPVGNGRRGISSGLSPRTSGRRSSSTSCRSVITGPDAARRVAPDGHEPAPADPDLQVVRVFGLDQGIGDRVGDPAQRRTDTRAAGAELVLSTKDLPRPLHDSPRHISLATTGPAHCPAGRQSSEAGGVRGSRAADDLQQDLAGLPLVGDPVPLGSAWLQYCGYLPTQIGTKGRDGRRARFSCPRERLVRRRGTGTVLLD